MSHDCEHGLDEGRRTFLRHALRWTAALLVGGGLAALTREGSEACPRMCTNCPQWTDCRRPEREPAASR
jgi:hypothetical protein